MAHAITPRVPEGPPVPALPAPSPGHPGGSTAVTAQVPGPCARSAACGPSSHACARRWGWRGRVGAPAVPTRVARSDLSVRGVARNRGDGAAGRCHPPACAPGRRGSARAARLTPEPDFEIMGVAFTPSPSGGGQSPTTQFGGPRDGEPLQRGRLPPQRPRVPRARQAFASERRGQGAARPGQGVRDRLLGLVRLREGGPAAGRQAGPRAGQPLPDHHRQQGAAPAGAGGAARRRRRAAPAGAVGGVASPRPGRRAEPCSSSRSTLPSSPP
jgi:hypothetical protein